MSSNKGFSLKGVLIPKLLNNSFASCFFINLAFFTTTYSKF